MKIGKPKTELQELINHYLGLKKIYCYEDMNCSYSRYLRPAKKLLDKLGVSDAKIILKKLSEIMDVLNLNWEIETIFKERWWHELVYQLPKNREQKEQIKKLEELKKKFIESHCLSENKFNKLRTAADLEAARKMRSNR